MRLQADRDKVTSAQREKATAELNQRLAEQVCFVIQGVQSGVPVFTPKHRDVLQWCTQPATSCPCTLCTPRKLATCLQQLQDMCAKLSHFELPPRDPAHAETALSARMCQDTAALLTSVVQSQAEQRAAAEAAQQEQQRAAALAAKKTRIPAALPPEDPSAVQVAVRLPSGARISHRCSLHSHGE